MTLPYDVARCACEFPCAKRDTCARFTDPGFGQLQPVADWSAPGVGTPCPAYISNATEGGGEG